MPREGRWLTCGLYTYGSRKQLGTDGEGAIALEQESPCLVFLWKHLKG